MLAMSNRDPCWWPYLQCMSQHFMLALLTHILCATVLQEHGRSPLLIMGAIKAALDPDNIMNPGKVGDGATLGR